MEQTQDVITPDPAADFVAWEAAEKAGKSLSETTTSAEGGEKPPEIPAVEPKETTSEPAGEKPAEAEAIPEPEAGKPKESESEKKAERKAEPEGEKAPWWYRKDLKRRERIEREMQGQLDVLRAELAAKTKAEPAAAQPVTEPSITPTAEPKEADFDTDRDYQRALNKYDAEQITARGIAKFQESVKRQLEAEDRETANRQVAAAQAALDAEWIKKVNAASERYEDFDEVVFAPNVQVTPLIDRFAHESEVGADIAYYLATHQEEVYRIAALPQLQQVRELVGIEAQFSKKAKTPETKTKVNGLPKPNPTTPIGGGNSIAAIKDQNDPEVLNDFPTWERLEREKTKRS